MLLAGVGALFLGLVAGPVQPSALATIVGAILVSELLTGALLYGQLWSTRAPALAPLAAAYLATSLLVLGYLLTFPGVLAPMGLLGANEQTALVFWCVWHTTFPVLVGVFAWCSRSPSPAIWSKGTTGLFIAGSIVASIALAIGTLFVATRIPGFPPQLVHHGTAGPVMTRLILPGICLIDTVALVMLAKTGARTIAQLW
ncbi:MAG TPA: MASE4 domain-containing protein, partial [Candidatus Baltobacteraceae bacterium]